MIWPLAVIGKSHVSERDVAKGPLDLFPTPTLSSGMASNRAVTRSKEAREV